MTEFYQYIAIATICSLVGCAVTAYILAESQRALCTSCTARRDDECRECTAKRRGII